MSDDNKTTDFKGLGDLSYEDIANADLFTLIGAKDMPEKDKKEMESVIFDTIHNRVTARISDMFDADEIEKWKVLDSDEDKNKFLIDHGINPEAIMLEEALIYKLELASLAKPMRDKLKNMKKE